MDIRLRGARNSTWPQRTPASAGPTVGLRSIARREVLLAMDAWRGAADVVEATARDWTSAEALRRAVAAGAYFAALDREERAAADYERAWETWWRAIA
jgi:hypothetical protein